jgi:hypothetical protein
MLAFLKIEDQITTEISKYLQNPNIKLAFKTYNILLP